MSIGIYQKKPVIIEAVRFMGGKESAKEILDWAEGKVIWYFNHDILSINTLEGNMSANVGDWIIKGIKGEFYPCRDDIFRASYDVVNEDSE